ncbi:hypothetical protein FOCG_17763 [Fusarium oxysporum f. sp. radicis-lycopersici 26381]|uniref:Nitrogen regulatory protein areA GATA-like domain-containing protein n=1 Tax=Fusarium oxysporum NRRL 32931 TaxID=660029 RepID=W9HCN6_FUSOX|nr:hypothetical protein FOYG_16921 [Fusarium oxysporum NRRL 32931]EWZ78607.1 hypothetical protein FOWG_17177 [Fusarium oxysporum f. sp. lycopersici MN25]EXL39629.1 hypothetical protein FOCG_17763 [Fusarium oxysporum f. sp. radicis-lycopersici 26381]
MSASFAREKFYVHREIDSDDGPETLSSSRSSDSYTISPTDHASSEVSDDTSRPDTPDHGEHAKDDMAVSSRPSRQVDYLSHDWREEDIWSSWRYIVMRRGELPNSIRLENAVWRTWVKAKNNLKTISPEMLDWLKDCDITWLYGPLHSVPNALNSVQTELSKVPLPRTDSHVNLSKRPILKVRSMSEEMLQRSLSTASLLKEATAAVKVEKTRDILGPHMSRSSTDYPYKPFSQRRLGGESSSANTSTESSRITSLNCERKHTRFNERVEQCIAVEVKGVDYDNDELDTRRYGDDSDPDDGVMVKRTKTRNSLLFQRKTSKSKPPKGETIAMLPSTTLKYREDTPEPRGTARKHSRSPIIPSSSQDILRPAKKSPMLFISEEGDNDNLDGVPLSPRAGWPSSPAEDANGGLSRSLFSESLCEVPAGMRRTPSRMFMPYEEGGVSSTDGVLERVIDTVNTARDIAHVMWSVGWRK